MIEGIDVSGWQKRIDWPAVARSGVKFVYIKATEGSTHLSPTAEQHALGATNAGLSIGYYHFATPRPDDARDEAWHMLEALDELPPYHLAPALDLERGKHDMTAAQLSQWCADFIQEMDQRCVIYVNPSYAKRLLPGYGLSQCPLWIAHHGVAEPRIPATSAWGDSDVGWSVWQYDTSTKVAGVDTDRCDRDHCASLEDIEATAQTSGVKPYMSVESRLERLETTVAQLAYIAGVRRT